MRATTDTPHSVCGCSRQPPARTVAGKEEVCRVRVGVREGGEGRDGEKRDREGGREEAQERGGGGGRRGEERGERDGGSNCEQHLPTGARIYTVWNYLGEAGGRDVPLKGGRGCPERWTDAGRGRAPLRASTWTMFQLRKK